MGATGAWHPQNFLILYHEALKKPFLSEPMLYNGQPELKFQYRPLQRVVCLLILSFTTS